MPADTSRAAPLTIDKGHFTLDFPLDFLDCLGIYFDFRIFNEYLGLALSIWISLIPPFNAINTITLPSLARKPSKQIGSHIFLLSI